MIQWIIAAFVLLLIMAALIGLLRKSSGMVFLANALLVNITPKGRETYLADAALTARYLLVKVGSDVNHVALCGAADIPFGVCLDMNPTTDTDTSYPLRVDLLGLNEDTERMIASAAIAAGDMVSAAASGKIQTLPATTGTYYIIGRAKTAAASSGDQIEVVPCFPIQRVVA